MATRIAALVRRNRDSAVPAPVQRGVWIASSQRLDTDPYLIHDLSRVRGDVDPAVLRACLAEAARRHDALRISFTGDQEPVQTIHESVAVDLEFVDLSGRPDASEAAMRLAQERIGRPFDLAVAPLWRVLLVRAGADEHLLLLTIHHLICDEWSLNLIHRDLEAEYAARLNGEHEQPPPAPDALDAPGYGDFAEWQAERFSSPSGERSIKHWHEALKGIPHELDLPVDFPRAGGVTHTGLKAGWSLTAEESAEFKELADRLGASPFLVMVTLLGVVLTRHSDQNDLVLGTVVSGRPTTATEQMVGHFANLLPIPLRLDGAPTFAEAVRAAKMEFLGLLDHQDVTFDRIVTELGARRTDLRMPLCQAHVSWSEGGEGGWNLGSARVEPIPARTGSAKAEIVLSGVRRRGELSFELIGEAGFFRMDTLRMLMDHFRQAARAAMADAGRSVAELGFVGAIEAQRLRTWRGTGRREGIDTTIPRLFEEAVAAHADRVAVVDRHSSLTYAELDARSARWAAALRRLGVRTDTVVGVAIERSTEMLAAVLGILRAGGAYMALNVDGPADYNAFCVAESKAAVVVARHGAEEILGEISCPVLWSEDVDGAAGSADAADRSAGLAGSAGSEGPGGPASRSDYRCTPDSLAFVSYTSGSTGKPKCVGITHRNILRVSYRSERILHGPGATFVHLAPLGFDISAMELWACLLHGGRLVIPPHGRLDIPELASLLREQSVTTWVTTTALFNQLVEQDLDALTGVGQVLIGGESAAPAVFDKVTSTPQTQSVSLLHCYGPTENTCVTTNTVIADRVGASVPIGTPIEGSTVYLLDSALEPVPVGVVGELFTGGVGVSRGYLNDAGLTATRFLPDPFSDVPGARMYRTGDVARWRADGQLDFVGRADRQVKVRGFRVEPGEIEARLLEHPDVSGAVVVLHVGADGHKQLVAYVVPGPNAVVTPGHLRAFLATRLPAHMIPAVITAIDRIPVTANGKVDRKALPEPRLVADKAEYLPPTTPTQTILAEAWASVLRLDQVSVAANFFELGGDSILAIRIAARARDAGIRISSTEIFQAPTVAELAAVVDARSGRAVTTEIVPVPDRETVLSPIQHWFVDRYGPENHFNQSVRLRSVEPLDETLVWDAFEAVVRHHDSLRLRLRSSGGAWTQAVGQEIDAELVTIIDVADDAAEREPAIERLGAELQRSLDVSAGTLIRMLLVPHSQGSDDVVIVAHHLGMDTVSWEVLVRHLTLAYRQLQAGRTPALPTETISFIDWTAALNKSSEEGSAEDVARRWQEIEERRTATANARAGLGADDTGAIGDAGRVRAELDESVTRDLLRRPVAACSVDVTAVLLTALARTLAEWADEYCEAGESEWVIDMEGHGRDALGASVDLSESLGWFTALFPVGLVIDSDAGVEEQLRATHRRLRAQPPGYTYGIHRHLRGDARLASPARSAVSFNYHGQLGGEPEPGLLLRRVGAGIGGDIGADLQRPNSLEFNAAVEGGCLRIRLSYPADRFAHREMQGVVDRFVDHCRVIAGAF